MKLFFPYDEIAEEWAQERAAIREYMGHQPRDLAERMAVRDVQNVNVESEEK